MINPGGGSSGSSGSGAGRSSPFQHQNQLFLGLFASFVTVGVLWYVFSFTRTSSSTNLLKDGGGDDNDDDLRLKKEGEDDDDDDGNKKNKKKKDSSSSSASSSSKTVVSSSSKSTTTTTTTETSEQEEIHKRVEEADKRGKVHFKSKQFLEAATCFSEAIDLIQSCSSTTTQKSLQRQSITLLNNRSAMYEKAGLDDLALSDCDDILREEPNHEKARVRKLRVLEKMGRDREALVEVCALQLRFMRDNRDKLRMGIPVKPPVSQDKIEELMGKLLPMELDTTFDTIMSNNPKRKNLPSSYTINQLLQSFSGYNVWMGNAARELSVAELTSKLDELDKQKVEGEEKEEEGATSTGGEDDEQDKVNAEKATLLLRRGRRYMYDKNYAKATEDFDTAYELTQTIGDDGDDTSSTSKVEELMGSDNYPRLLEWVAMCKHLRYDLRGALKCYEKCSDLEPENAEILIKRAGVKMDAGKHDESFELFSTALGLQPDAADALLHRSNLLLVQQKNAEAKKDILRCLELRPDYVVARLRLATVLMSEQDLVGAKRTLDKCEEIDSNSSDVHSFRGEIYFAEGNFSEARNEFEKAMGCHEGGVNPTPYVNAALAVMNTPTETGLPDIQQAISFLQKAIDIDPMFHAAYVHLGQLKLSMATSLVEARSVIELYDKGIEQCRTKEDLRDLVSMRILTVSQVDAASSLGMETLNMQ